MFSVVTGDPREIADEMLTNPDVDLVTFTGGVPIGKYIAAKAVYKRQVLELGGNDPIIVMEDADLDEAATLAAAGSYKNSGQRCTAVKRMLVHEAVADAFVELLLAQTQAWTYGDPMDPDDRHGHGDRRGRGEVVRGPGRTTRSPAARGCCTATCAAARCTRRPSSTTSTPDDAARQVRDLRPGVAGDPLHATSTTRSGSPTRPPTGCRRRVCTNRLDYITRFVTELHVGTVNVREVPGYRLELTPFGGIKDSGLGYKEGVQEAMKSFTNIKTYSLPW